MSPDDHPQPAEGHGGRPPSPPGQPVKPRHRSGKACQQRVYKIGEDCDRHIDRLDRLEQEKHVSGKENAERDRNPTRNSKPSPTTPRKVPTVSTPAPSSNVTLVSTSELPKETAPAITGAYCDKRSKNFGDTSARGQGRSGLGDYAAWPRTLPDGVRGLPCAWLIASTERSIAVHSREISTVTSDSAPPSPALAPAASDSTNPARWLT